MANHCRHKLKEDNPMKKNSLIFALILLLALPVIGLATDDFGAAAVKDGETYTIEEMLTFAIQDEYLAQAEYKAIIATFGVDRPFSNIMQAEASHMEHLLPLFEAYGITVPADTATEHVILPETIEEIYDIGIAAEIHNISMYETFLKQEDLPEDVKNVFEALKRASENHLSAFQRNAEKPGNGRR